MILAIDVGNTNIIIGVIDAKKTYFVERITTTIGKPNLEYAVALKSILEIYHIAPDQLDGAIVSSVVPPLNRTILAAIRKITGLNAMLVGSGMKTGLNILMDNPKSVGSDMIVTQSVPLQSMNRQSSSSKWEPLRPCLSSTKTDAMSAARSCRDFAFPSTA